MEGEYRLLFLSNLHHAQGPWFELCMDNEGVSETKPERIPSSSSTDTPSSVAQSQEPLAGAEEVINEGVDDGCPVVEALDNEDVPRLRMSMNEAVDFQCTLAKASPAAAATPQNEEYPAEGSQPPPASMLISIDKIIGVKLDAFFNKHACWHLVLAEIKISSHLRSSAQIIQTDGSDRHCFKVQLPRPYTGVQCRKSKHEHDRHPRYVSNAAMIVGELEDNGEWLKISHGIYLPTRVCAIQILEPSPQQEGLVLRLESRRLDKAEALQKQLEFETTVAPEKSQRLWGCCLDTTQRSYETVEVQCVANEDRDGVK